MTRQLRRVHAGERDRALRRALERHRKVSSTQGANPDAPLPWWRRIDTAAHAAWIATPTPAAVAYADLTPTSQWPAGQPVTLITQGHEHTCCWVRITSSHVGPRWLDGDIPRRLVSPAELTFRNPRMVWCDSWRLQLALALLSADNDERCQWLRSPDPAEEPELAELHALAQEELARRPSLTFLPARGSIPSPAPTPRRGWHPHELETMARLVTDAVEPLTRGRGD